MATVRITEALVDEVGRAARNLFSARLITSNAANPREKMLTALAEYAYGKMLVARQVSADTFAGVPKDFLNTAHRVHIHNVDGEYVGSYGALQTERPAPDAWGGSHDFNSTDSGFPIDAWTEWKVWHEAHQRLQQEQAAYRDKVVGFLRGHTTLKAALAEWPALWELIPQNYRDRHNSVDARMASSKMEKRAVDVGDLNAGLVIAKLANSTDKLS